MYYWYNLFTHKIGLGNDEYLPFSESLMCADDENDGRIRFYHCCSLGDVPFTVSRCLGTYYHCIGLSVMSGSGAIVMMCPWPLELVITLHF